MTDNNQLHQEFLNDFTELLRKYNAEFDMVECYDPEVFFYNADGEGKIKVNSFILPRYIKPN